MFGRFDLERTGKFCMYSGAKCKELGKEEIFKMWGINEVEWAQNGNDNGAGWVITMWRRNFFRPSNITNESNYSIIEGQWRIREALHITIVNMYNFGLPTEKRVVWEVRERRREQNTKTWCVVGDFNSIRSLGERRNAEFEVNHRMEMRRFNEFIENMELVDIPMRWWEESTRGTNQMAWSRAK